MPDLRFSSLSLNKTSPSTSFAVRRMSYVASKCFEEQLENVLVNWLHIPWLNPLLLNQLATYSTVHNLGSTPACLLPSGTVASAFWAESMGDVVGRGTKDG